MNNNKIKNAIEGLECTEPGFVCLKEEFYKECNVLTSTVIIMLHKLVDGGIGYEDALAIVASFISSHQNISQIKEESETKKDSLL